MSNNQEYLQFAEKLAYQAGKIMLKHFQIGIEKEIKGDSSPVTVADKQINRIVIESIQHAYPTHSILGEEESLLKKGSDYLWVCDPIDGTTPYTFGLSTNLFSLALVKDGEPILGVLYDPYMRRLYKASKSGGAFLNDTKIRVSRQKVLAKSFAALPGFRSGLLDVKKLFAGAIERGIRQFALLCITIEGALVASGQIAGTVFSGRTAWDIAAVKIIVEEAGGRVTDLYGREQRYDGSMKGAIISNGFVHEELTRLVKDSLL